MSPRRPRRSSGPRTKTPATPGPARTMTQAIQAAIFQKYLVEQSGWGVLREVSIDDLDAAASNRGVRRADRVPAVRRIDFLLMRISRSSKPRHERIALEVKVSRADFKRDTDDKRRAWFSVADRFAYVVPKGLISKDEVPEGCGLIEFDDSRLTATNQLSWTVIAPKREQPPIPFSNQFFAYLLGRASRAEEKLRSIA